MKLLIIASTLLLFSSPAIAMGQKTHSFMTLCCSLHKTAGWNESNPGLIYRYTIDNTSKNKPTYGSQNLYIGQFINSSKRRTTLLGIGRTFDLGDSFDFSTLVYLNNGYRPHKDKYTLAFMFNLRYHDLNILFVPDVLFVLGFTILEFD